MPVSDEKPIVRCLVGCHVYGGFCIKTRVVPLDEAEELRRRFGFWVLGPDPYDWEALKEWERDHADGA